MCFSDHRMQQPLPLIFSVLFYMYPVFDFLSDNVPFRRINFGMSEQIFKGFLMPVVLELKSFSSSSEQPVEKEGNGKHTVNSTHLPVDFFVIAFCFHNACFVQHAYYESRTHGESDTILKHYC